MTHEQTETNSQPKTHATLSPKTNLILVFTWAIGATFLLLAVQPRLHLALAAVAGALGAVAGVMQHLSISQDPEGFIAASSLMGVRRALTNTSWGRKYIAWLYFCKVILILVTFGLIRKPLIAVALGYLAAYCSLMFVRDVVTLRDTFALHALDKRSAPPPTFT